MSALVVDTHAIVWYLSADSRLSVTAARALDFATAFSEPIFVPSICLVELTFLVERGRLPAAARDLLVQALDDPETPCRVAPLDRVVADALVSVDSNQVPDLPGRIIAATAAALRMPLVTCDARIRASGLHTIW